MGKHGPLLRSFRTERGNVMSHTYSKLLLHYVFSTKERRLLIDDAWCTRLYSYMSGIVREQGAHLVRAGGIADHVHLLIEAKPTHAPADLIRLVKAGSSKWINDERLTPHDFAWQIGYGVFSVSRSQLDAVTAYIDNQAEHHRRQTFQEELLAMLERHGIEYDERFLWD